MDRTTQENNKATAQMFDQESDTAKKKEVYFDIANSVKGGSGKSTFSLLLAAACNRKEHADAYILDLDLRGTSWEKNYDSYLSTGAIIDQDGNRPTLRSLSNGARPEDIQDYEKYPFINSLMWNTNRLRVEDCWSEIFFDDEDVKVEGSSNSRIRVFPAKAKNGKDIDKLEVDIFEHAIEQIILTIMEQTAGDNNVNELHFILDMPPSYEKHAERIIKHLLTSQDSDFYRLCEKREGVFKVFNDYNVNLFMVCSLSPAHVIQNSLYVKSLLDHPNYSNALQKLVYDKRFSINFILNDISNLIGDARQGYEDLYSESKLLELFKANEAFFMSSLQMLQEFSGDDINEPIKLRVIRHLKLYGTTWYFENDPKRPFRFDSQTLLTLNDIESLL